MSFKLMHCSHIVDVCFMWNIINLGCLLAVYSTFQFHRYMDKFRNLIRYHAVYLLIITLFLSQNVALVPAILAAEPVDSSNRAVVRLTSLPAQTWNSSVNS